MTEKKTKTSKLKNFLVTGSVDEKEEERIIEEAEQQEEPQTGEWAPEYDAQWEQDAVVEDIVDEAAVVPEPVCEAEEPPAVEIDLSSLENEISELKAMVADLSSRLDKCATSKEQMREYSLIVDRRDAELANRKFMGMLEQLSAMREDFFKLCGGINAKLDSFSPKDILRSFEAYGVDMENILIDCGVQIGPSKFERLNTIHQRIVDVIPTDDESMNGMIAERVSDGYVYQGRVLQKEKVKIYRFSEKRKTEGDEEK